MKKYALLLLILFPFSLFAQSEIIVENELTDQAEECYEEYTNDRVKIETQDSDQLLSCVDYPDDPEDIEYSDLAYLVQRLCVEIDSTIVRGEYSPDFRKIFIRKTSWRGTEEEFRIFFPKFFNKYKQYMVCNENDSPPFRKALIYKRILQMGVPKMFDKYLYEFGDCVIDYNAYEIIDGKKETIIDFIDKEILIHTDSASSLIDVREILLDEFGAKRGKDLD